MALVDPSLGPCCGLETSGAHPRAVRSPLMLSDSVAGNENPPSEARSRSPLKGLNVFLIQTFSWTLLRSFMQVVLASLLFIRKNLFYVSLETLWISSNKTFRQRVNLVLSPVKTSQL